MGIYIKNLKMSEHCMDCPFMVSRDNDDCILQSAEANENFENWEQMKAGCPLIEVREPHGPLYDLYDIFDNMQHSRGIDINCSSPGMTADLFQGYAPVIPASKED